MTEDRKGKPIASFEDLEVFKRAYRVSLEVHRISLQFPKIEQYGLADQLRRASKSICANLAEGFGKQSRSPAEFKRFIQISIGSADEMRVWIRYCLDLGYIEQAQWQTWRDEYQEIARMLQGLSNSWK
jgi:four helix bundle protein